MVARVAVVALNGNGMRLADDVAIRRQDFGKGVPIIGIENTFRQVFDFIV